MEIFLVKILSEGGLMEQLYQSLRNVSYSLSERVGYHSGSELLVRLYRMESILNQEVVRVLLFFNAIEY